MQKIITHTGKQTQARGKEFAKTVQNGTILALHGDLGSGKTTFVQGFAEGLGVVKKIISPTFIIIRMYALSSGEFYHLDLYRLSKADELSGLGIEDILRNKNNIVVIEWPELANELLPTNTMHIYFRLLENNDREITFK